MIKSDGLIRLLLKKGRQTTEEELKENYIKLQKFTHSKEETQELQELYDRAYQFLEEEKENRKKQFLKEGALEQKGKMNFSREYLLQLVKSLKDSVCFLSKGEGKEKITERIFLEGILKYRTPFGIVNYINAYTLKGEKENFYTTLNLPALASFSYQKLVKETLFCKKNLEEAKENRGGYLGTITKDEKQGYVWELDEEQMAACLAYKEREKFKRRKMEGRE